MAKRAAGAVAAAATLLAVCLCCSPIAAMGAACPFASATLGKPVNEMDSPPPHERWVAPNYSAPSNCTAQQYEQIGRELATLANNTQGLTLPQLVRLAFHSCGTWSASGRNAGCNGGWIQFPADYTHTANVGLQPLITAVKQLKARFPCITFADLAAFGGAVAPEAAGGPPIAWYPGRRDALSPGPARPAYSARLPGAPLGSAGVASFYVNLGLTMRESVALTGGGHSFGGGHPNASGWDGYFTSEEDIWPTPPNRYFLDLVSLAWEYEVLNCPLQDKCVQWVLKPGQNVTSVTDEGKKVMRFPADMAMRTTSAFSYWLHAYARNGGAFLHDFQRVMQRVLQLGAGETWDVDASYQWKGLKGDWQGFGPSIEPQLDTQDIPPGAADPRTFVQTVADLLVDPGRPFDMSLSK